MKRLPVAIACAVAAMLTAVSADDYIDSLKAQVRGYENMTTGRFAPMYEPLARQMVLEYGLKSGVALDIGSSC
ncbi:MAG: hypothetical protein GW867_33820, partial [Armatimonadetes bacterium]|nr:hypothetical protein [Armatimonadota bacterium]